MKEKETDDEQERIHFGRPDDGRSDGGGGDESAFELRPLLTDPSLGLAAAPAQFEHNVVPHVKPGRQVAMAPVGIEIPVKGVADHR